MAERIKVGDHAPDFTLKNQRGEPVGLKDYLGKKSVVLFFYPKDSSSGCTKEACKFRDNYEDFKDALERNVDGITYEHYDEYNHPEVNLVGDIERDPFGGLVRPQLAFRMSKVAFRYFTHEATGGSDHVCFNNASVRVPGIELFTWPDQWYHADTDTPDKSDPTQMKRIAFIGAAAAWAAADCGDAVLPELLRAVSSFGYARVGKRELPRALHMVTDAGAADLEKAMNRALGLTALAAAREKGAVESVREVYSGSETARGLVTAQARQWELYGSSLDRQVREFAAYRAAVLKTKAPAVRTATADEKRAGSAVPALAPGVKGKEFTLESSERYRKYAAANPDAVKGLKLPAPQRRAALNYIDGRRTLAVIRASVEAETGTEVVFADLLSYVDFLKAVGWIR